MRSALVSLTFWGYCCLTVVFQRFYKLSRGDPRVFFEGVGENVDVFKPKQLCCFADINVLVAQNALGTLDSQGVFISRWRGLKLVGKASSEL